MTEPGLRCQTAKYGDGNTQTCKRYIQDTYKRCIFLRPNIGVAPRVVAGLWLVAGIGALDACGMDMVQDCSRAVRLP